MLNQGLVQMLRRASELPDATDRRTGMKAYKCDRCKRYLEGYPELTVPALVNYFQDRLHSAHELCTSCSHALRKFFNNEPVGPLQ